MYKGKERRKHRDYTEEMVLSHALMGAVIRQAFDDVKQLKEVREKLRDINGVDFKHFKSYREYKKVLMEEKRQCLDAVDFFKTKRLDDFIHSNMLEIEPDYIRRKFRELGI